jgi:hypothetical protein
MHGLTFSIRILMHKRLHPPTPLSDGVWDTRHAMANKQEHQRGEPKTTSGAKEENEATTSDERRTTAREKEERRRMGEASKALQGRRRRKKEAHSRTETNLP